MNLTLGGDESRLTLDSRQLTTHAVILGMTGSGKTGLGIVMLEEMLRARIPSLIVDPKGDMGNLALLFPKLDAASFEPWVDPSEAQRDNKSPAELAQTVADRWRQGLAKWDIDGTTLSELRAQTRIRIFTPGSRTGIPINAMGSLAAPGTDLNDEAVQDALSALVVGLLGLVDIDADPFTSREAILLSNIIHHGWSAGHDLDFAALISAVAEPPMRKLGVFDLDTFYPRDERMKLAMRLNALVASPAFAPWTEGEPLDVGALLTPNDGKTPASVFYLAHLNDRQRMFFVTLLLGQLLTWMRRQPGSEALRAALYMDEVFGFLPPTASPASKKPLLTLLKQARAFGVGLVLSTQNPVDLDYKALSNAGTWLIGRLQTERDQERLIAGLGSSEASTALRESLGELKKREFVLFGTRQPQPVRFSTRWAMSYLRGPMTRNDIERLRRDSDTAGQPGPSAAPSLVPTRSASSDTSPPLGRSEPEKERLPDDVVARMPDVASGIEVRFAAPSAPWIEDAGGRGEGASYIPRLAFRLSLRFDERKASLNHVEEWEAILTPTAPIDVDTQHAVDFDDRDFLEESPRPKPLFRLTDADLSASKLFRDAKKAVVDWAYHERELELRFNKALKIYQRPGEERDAFETRCQDAVDRMADGEAAKLRERFEKKRARILEKRDRAERKVEDLEAEARRRKSEEWVSGAGALLEVFLGGRSSRSAMLKRAGRKASGTMGRRSRTRRSQDRAEEAAARLDGLEVELEELDEELADALETIEARSQDVLRDTETMNVRLEKNDIRVESMVLVWVPG
ncbi:MAG: DUF87 domain-containing protein [Myxococcota bacterium]